MIRYDVEGPHIGEPGIMFQRMKRYDNPDGKESKTRACRAREA